MNEKWEKEAFRHEGKSKNAENQLFQHWKTKNRRKTAFPILGRIKNAIGSISQLSERRKTSKVFYLTFGIFRLSKSWEMQPMAFFILPNIGKIVFRWFLVFPMLGKPIFSVFWFSPRGGKPPFLIFRSSYPYESFFLPFFINCTPYLSDFSRKCMPRQALNAFGGYCMSRSTSRR